MEVPEVHDTFDNSKDQLNALFSSFIKVSGFCGFQSFFHGGTPGFGHPAWFFFFGMGLQAVRPVGAGSSDGDQQINAIFPQSPDCLPAGVTSAGECCLRKTDCVFHR